MALRGRAGLGVGVLAFGVLAASQPDGVVARARTVTVAAVTGQAATRPAQTTTAPDRDPEIAGRYLRVRLRLGEKAAIPGGRVTLIADVVPGPKMHVYAPGQEGYIPVALTLAASRDVKASAPRFPPATDYYFEPTRVTVKVFDRPFRIAQEITLASTAGMRRRAAAREALTVRGTLDYQACDDAVCYRPETLDLTWKIALAPGR